MQLLIFNEEFLVSACHQRALITSLPFVHTARRSYRLNDPVRPLDWGNEVGSPNEMPREVVQTLSFRGRRSRNKVSVGEPAEGSLTVSFHSHPLGIVSPTGPSFPSRVGWGLARRARAWRRACARRAGPGSSGGGWVARGVGLSCGRPRARALVPAAAGRVDTTVVRARGLWGRLCFSARARSAARRRSKRLGRASAVQGPPFLNWGGRAS